MILMMQNSSVIKKNNGTGRNSWVWGGSRFKPLVNLVNLWWQTLQRRSFYIWFHPDNSEPVSFLSNPQSLVFPKNNWKNIIQTPSVLLPNSSPKKTHKTVGFDHGLLFQSAHEFPLVYTKWGLSGPRMGICSDSLSCPRWSKQMLPSIRYGL